MSVEEALAIVDAVLHPERLTKVQELVFRQAWEKQSYREIAASISYDTDYIRETDAQLWRLLSQAFREKVTKNNFQLVLRRREKSSELDPSIQHPKLNTQHYYDWGEAVDVSVFYGRTEELATLKQWVVQDRCCLVTLLGMGGIGKTALAVKLAEQTQN